jgi:signal transduction histidine kinase
LAANQYLEHRDAIEENRKKMTDFLKARGNEVAEEILEDADFPQADWRKIVVESKRETDKEPLASGLGTLTHVFEKLERLMRSETVDDQLIKELLGQASENLDDTLSTTQDKLAHLSKQIQKEEETGTIGGQAMTMNRKELLMSISEVAQELMQPLTAMNASLEMMIHGYVGAVSEEQNDMLTLAYNSGEHLKHLMNELITIVGFPANKGIDKRFHTTSRQVVWTQDD